MNDANLAARLGALESAQACERHINNAQGLDRSSLS